MIYCSTVRIETPRHTHDKRLGHCYFAAVRKAPKTLEPRVVFFDLGMVIVDVEIQNGAKFWTENTGRPEEEFSAVFFESGIKDELDVGTIGLDDAITRAQALCNNVPRRTLIDSWNAILTKREYMKSTVETIARVSRCAVISNTDPIHAAWIEENAGIHEHIEHWIYSFDTGSMKPEPHILEYAIDRMGVEPQHTLLLDDRLDNLETAKQLGMDTIWFDNRDNVMKSLRDRMLI